MCKYCTNINQYLNKEFNVVPRYGRSWISLEDENKYELNFEVDDIVHCAGFEINYCPICGEKLS